MEFTSPRLACEEHLDAVCEKLTAALGFPIMVDDIRWDLKSNRVAGQACGRNIRLSPGFLATAGLETYKSTVTHEVAHVAVFIWKNRMRGMGLRLVEAEWSAHGTRWKHVMRLAGAEPRRRHTYEAPSEHKYKATCGCPDKVHGWNRKPKYAINTYKCKRCNCKLSAAV